MIPNRAPSPVDKLALAVVHAPERAIPAPAGAREESLRFLLQTAADSGVVRVATRPEGDGERWLGQSWPFPSPFQVSVRTVPVSDGVDRVEARARRSLERLGLPRGDALLISSASDLAGEPITHVMTDAPSGDAIGGLKVATKNAWFAARPSGTEDVYKIYAESFLGDDHLARVQDEARQVVAGALGA